MEIINYVQDNSSMRRFNLPIFQRKHKNQVSYNSTIFAGNTAAFTDEAFGDSSFSAQKIKLNFSLKAILKFVGSSVTKAQHFVAVNWKKIIIFLAAAAFATTATVIGVKIHNHVVSHTGPLQLQTENGLELEQLNELMAQFALEGIVDYDEQGNLLDTEGFAPQVFTQPVTYQNYKVKSGDTISGIAKKFGLTNLSTLISINNIDNVRQLRAGQQLKIPSVDGITYTVKSGDTIDSIISKNSISLEALLDVNDLSTEELQVGQKLFLPGVALDSQTLRNAMGDLFKMPITAPFRWTSMYGKRIDPIAHVESFHTGVDMACPTGTPIKASMSGRVIKTGVTRVYGNYVIIDHGNGYQTLYAHMSKITAVEGQWVNQGSKIGLVGSTGYSTGPHLHFTVYKNGELINPMSVLNK